MAIVLVVSLLPRIISLGAFISPDEPQWYRNTIGFKQGLLSGNLAELYQQPHPGITTMWLAAATIDSESWAARRLPQAIAISLFIALASGVAGRLWQPYVGLAQGLALALNPMLIAHSRVLAMDALLAVFILLWLLLTLLWLRERKRGWLVFDYLLGTNRTRGYNRNNQTNYMVGGCIRRNVADLFSDNFFQLYRRGRVYV